MNFLITLFFRSFIYYFLFGFSW